MLGRAGLADSPAGRVVHGVCGGVPNVPVAALALLAGRRRRRRPGQGGLDGGELGVRALGIALYCVEELGRLTLEVSPPSLVLQGLDLRTDALDLRSHLRDLGMVRPPLGPVGLAVVADVVISLVHG